MAHARRRPFRADLANPATGRLHIHISLATKRALIRKARTDKQSIGALIEGFIQRAVGA